MTRDEARVFHGGALVAVQNMEPERFKQTFDEARRVLGFPAVKMGMVYFCRIDPEIDLGESWWPQ
jgi:hypothetical protein